MPVKQIKDSSKLQMTQLLGHHARLLDKPARPPALLPAHQNDPGGDAAAPGPALGCPPSGPAAFAQRSCSCHRPAGGGARSGALGSQAHKLRASTSADRWRHELLCPKGNTRDTPPRVPALIQHFVLHAKRLPTDQSLVTNCTYRRSGLKEY